MDGGEDGVQDGCNREHGHHPAQQGQEQQQLPTIRIASTCQISQKQRMMHTVRGGEDSPAGAQTYVCLECKNSMKTARMP